MAYKSLKGNFKIISFLLMLLCGMGLNAIQISSSNIFHLNNLDFSLRLVGEKRVSDFNYAPLSFTATSSANADSLVVVYSSSDLVLRLTLLPKDNLGVKAWQVKANANFLNEVYLRQLYFQLDFSSPSLVSVYKGIPAIEHHSAAYDKNITPYSDQVMQYANSFGSFWIVASNYYGCSGVERLGAFTINLYDHNLHFFRKFRQATQAADLPRDTMFKPAGSTQNWSFMLFAEKPVLLQLSRWPSGKKAALCITNDADAESNNRLAAMYLGSSDPTSAKYLTSGLIAHEIRVSNTVFGTNQNAMQDMWQTIYDNGNSIGYHTFSATADAPGTNAQALLHDLVPFNIRLWVDHNIPQNPEDLGWSGLDPTSPNYVGDVINQSNIDYAWFNDTPTTNPFNAFDDPWRLPHLIYEATCLTKPVWFFGRTRTEVWEYTNGNFLIDMKNVLTAQNIEKLLAANGLHIACIHFGAAWSGVVPFYQITPGGAYEIRDDVEEMLQMLAYYRDYRGLWIDTAERIFDRMLATEQVKVSSVVATGNPHEYQVTLRNYSNHDLPDFSFSYGGTDYNIGTLAAGDHYQFTLANLPETNALLPASQFEVHYQQRMIMIQNKTTSFSPETGIKVFNLKGQLVTSYRISGTTPIAYIPFSGYAAGVYFVRIETEGKVFPAEKLIVLK